MKYVFALLTVLLLPQLILAQECTGTLKGVVSDFHDKTPLAGATIQLYGTNRAVITDVDGSFLLPDLCNGSIEIEVSHPECTSQFYKVIIDGTTLKQFTLEHHLEELNEVKVVGDLISDKTNSSQEATLKIGSLERYSSGSLGDALKQISGVSALTTGSKIVKPVIQGLNGSRVLILNNGVRMQDMEWGDEHAPNVDLNASNSVTVVKGAAALAYGGDAIGGVILMTPAPYMAQDSLYGKTILNGATNGRGGSITSELIKTYENGWFIKGQGSLKRFGDSEAPNNILSNTAIAEYGATLALGKHNFIQGWDVYYSFFKANIGILRASHIGNIDDLIRAINSTTPLIENEFSYSINRPNQEVTHHLGKLNYYRRFEGLGRWNVQYDFQNNRRFEFDVRVGADRNKPSLDLELQTHTLSSEFKIDAKKDYKMHLGLLARYQDHIANPDTGVRRLIPDYDKYDFGAFVTGDYFISNTVVLDAGLRYDFSRIDAKKFYQTSRWQERGYNTDFQDIIIDDLGTQLLTNPVFDYHNISATVGTRLEVAKNTTLRINYAMSQRAPNPSELFSDGLHHSAARIELGDLRIESETSHKVSVSLQKEETNWGYTISPFLNTINDFILLEPTGVEFTLRGAFPVWEYRQTNARLIGFDLNAFANWSETWRTDHRFSLVKGKDTEQDLALINIPAANTVNSIIFNKKEWNNLRISLDSQYVFRQNEFPDDILVNSPDLGQDVLLEINTPPDAYHLMSLDSEMQFTLSNNKLITLGFSIHNLWNTEYREYLNRLRFFADDLGRNFLVRLKFNY
ncbi:TonB-dependent receptor [Arenibacter sp. GZD96]|uniref:TonB-dependent receptor n=1 Tax=Aurantibrevibacter litoralis TaxID=3106030 RepID=UPI002AFFB3FD|nr:TonB-dependent receptor [Arenibacter sp. GZD-96]MEA1786368.1 TonB-dependent receptor [Arenibacter sp. GZD-96]